MSLIKTATLAALKAGASVPGLRLIERTLTLSTMRDVLAMLQVDCVFDVGANVGQFGLELRGIGYKGWIVSFEPNPEAVAEMKKGLDDKWLCYPVALGAEDAEREFNVTGLSTLGSFLRPKGDPVAKRIPVTVRRLDRMVDEIVQRTGSKRPFLKMDTQGFDVEVVRGCGQRVSAFCGLLSELSVTPIYDGMPTYVEALTLYHSLGFKLHSVHVVNRCDDGSVLEYDGIMIREQ